MQRSAGMWNCLWMTHIVVLRLEKGRMGNSCCLNDVVEREIERKTGCNICKWRQRCAAAVGKNRTAIAIASSTVYDYTLLLETVDDLAHALPSVFRGVFGEPFHEIEI